VVPASLAATVRDSVSEGVAVAQKIGSAALFALVRSAFVHGMDIMLAVCGGIAVAGIVLTLVFLPRRADPVEGLESAAAPALAPGAAEPVAGAASQGTESAGPSVAGR
jgi:hypothetical protein